MEFKQYIKIVDATLDKNDICIFFGNSKAASSSMHFALGERCIRLKNNESDFIKKLDSYSMNDIQNLFKFTIVRNPWMRLISAYTYLINLNYIPNITFDSFILDVVSKIKYQDLLYPTLKNIISKHTSFQFPKAYFHNQKFSNRIIKIEHIIEEWEDLSTILHIDKNLPHKNKTVKNDTEYFYLKNLYNNKTKSIVSKLYKQDIDLFNYSF